MRVEEAWLERRRREVWGPHMAGRRGLQTLTYGCCQRGLQKLEGRSFVSIFDISKLCGGYVRYARNNLSKAFVYMGLQKADEQDLSQAFVWKRLHKVGPVISWQWVCFLWGYRRKANTTLASACALG